MKNLSQAELERLLQASLEKKPVKLSGYILQGLVFDQQDFSYADFQGSDLSNASFKRTTLYGANLRDTCLEGANLENTCLERANLSYANLSSALLKGTNLSYANLKYARLVDTFIHNVNITNVKALGCQVGGASWKYETLIEWVNKGAIPINLNALIIITLDSDLYGPSANEKIPELVEKTAVTSLEPPQEAPEQYVNRPAGESAGNFLKRVWGKYLKRFGAERDYIYQDQLWKLDPSLRGGMQTYCRNRKQKVSDYIPPKQARTRAERHALWIDWRQRVPTQQEVKDLLRILSNFYQDLRKQRE